MAEAEIAGEDEREIAGEFRELFAEEIAGASASDDALVVEVGISEEDFAVAGALAETFGRPQRPLDLQDLRNLLPRER